MAITLDIEGSVEKIVSNIQNVTENLIAMNEEYDDIKEASRSAVSGIKADEQVATDAVNKHTQAQKEQTETKQKSTKATQDNTKAIGEQKGVLHQLEDELKRLQTEQRKATDPESIKQYNRQIVNCEQTIAHYRTVGTQSLNAVSASATASGEVFATLHGAIGGIVAELAIASVGAIGLGAALMISKDSVKSYIEAEAHVRLLQNALVNIGNEGSKAIKELVDQSAELSAKNGKSIFGDDEIMLAQRAFAVYGMGTKQIKDAIPVLLEFATQNQITLEQAADAFIKGTNGQGRALREYGITVKDTGDRNQNYANTLEAMTKKSKGAFDSLSDGEKAAAQLKDSFGEFEEFLGSKMEPSFTAFKNNMSGFVNDTLPKFIEFIFNIPAMIDKYSSSLIALVTIFLVYNSASIVAGLNSARLALLTGYETAATWLSTAAKTAGTIAVGLLAAGYGVLTGEITLAELATIAFGSTAAIATAGVTLLIGAIIAIGGAMAIYYNNQRLAISTSKIMADLSAQAAKNTAEEKSKLEALIAVAKDENIAKETRLKAIKEINEISPEYLGNITLETINTDAARAAIEGYILSLNKKALAQAFDDKRKEISKRLIDAENSSLDDNSKWYDYLAGVALNNFSIVALKSIKRRQETIDGIKAESKALEELFKKKLEEGAIELTGGLKTADLNKTTDNQPKDKSKEEEKKAKELADLKLAMQKEGLFKELQAEQKAYDEKKAIAIKYGVDYTELTNRFNEKVLAIRQKFNNLSVAADVASMKDGLAKQLALEDIRYEDLMQRYEKLGMDTSEITARHAEQVLKIKSEYIEKEYKQQEDKDARQADLQNLAGIERLNFLKQQSDKEIDFIEATLKAENEKNGETGLKAEQWNALLLLKKKSNDAYLAALKEFNTKEMQTQENHEILMLELQRGNFKNQSEFEKWKGEEILKIRLKYAQMQLALVEQTEGKESDAALKFTEMINTLKAQMQSLEDAKPSKCSLKGDSIWSMMGLDSEQASEAQSIMSGIQTAMDVIKDVVSQINEMRLQSAQAALDAANAEVEATEKTIASKEHQLDREIELAKLGYANNIEKTQKEIAELKRHEAAKKAEAQKALEEKKKIQKQQMIIDTVTQASSLITAAAQVFQSVASIPFVGVALGAALVAAMIGSFIASKVMMFKAANDQKAEKGLYGIVKGKRHYHGGEKFDSQIEVEDGEAYGVFSRSATSKHNHIIEPFVNAINNDDKRAMYDVAALLAGTGVTVAKEPSELISKGEVKIEQQKLALIGLSIHSDEIKESNRLLKAILNKGDDDVNVEHHDGFRVEKRGNHTRTIITTKS